MVGRRRFIALLAGAPLCRAAVAQAPRGTYRIGFWAQVAPSRKRGEKVRWLEDGLAANGFVGGANTEIHYEYAEINAAPDFLAMQARKLVALKPDVICADFPFARVLQRQTVSIPIIFLNEPDPVGTGLVQDLRRPGGNITGTVSVYDEASEKRFELARELLPKARRVALVADYRDCRAAVPSFPARQRSVAARLGLESIEADVDARKGRDLATMLEWTMQSRADVIVVYGVVGGAVNRVEVVRNFEKARRVPFIGDGSWGVVSFGADFAEMRQRAVAMVVRVLRGARPADTPVDQPSRFRLVVDLGIAREIGVTIPATILVRADRINR